jgi:hypothetical protein
VAQASIDALLAALKEIAVSLSWISAALWLMLVFKNMGGRK